MWGSDLLAMIYPRCCEVCGAPLVMGEEILCTGCNYELPRCSIHTDTFNTIHRRLAGHVPLERAAGYFYYNKGARHTRLIHVAKYNGRPGVARFLARQFAREIIPDGFFKDIDIIVPVPMHWLKQMRRGYNQTHHIAAGLSDAVGIGVSYNLKAMRRHATQTRRNAYLRWLNSQSIYGVERGDELDGKHLLVVDDVITSGATMLACCEALHRAAPGATISVLSLGVTDLQ